MTKFQYIIEDIDSTSTGGIINSDGSKTLLSSFVPSDADGETYNFAINALWDGANFNLSSGDFNGDGVDDLAFSDYHGDVALLLSDNGEWGFRYIIEDIDSTSTGGIINSDGSKTLLSSFVPSDADGETYNLRLMRFGMGRTPTSHRVILMEMV